MLGMPAPPHLVERARAVHVVGHELAALEALLRDGEERDALDAERRAVDAGEREVDDVLGQVLIAARDEDLVAPDQVVARGRVGVALVFTSVRLLPACGSVRAIVPVHSPLYMRVIISALSASLPNASMRCAAPAGQAEVADGAEVRGHPVERAERRDRVRELLAADGVRAASRPSAPARRASGRAPASPGAPRCRRRPGAPGASSIAL